MGSKERKCTFCEGSGNYYGPPDGSDVIQFKSCPSCNGRGYFDVPDTTELVISENRINRSADTRLQNTEKVILDHVKEIEIAVFRDVQGIIDDCEELERTVNADKDAPDNNDYQNVLLRVRVAINDRIRTLMPMTEIGTKPKKNG